MSQAPDGRSREIRQQARRDRDGGTRVDDAPQHRAIEIRFGEVGRVCVEACLTSGNQVLGGINENKQRMFLAREPR